MCIYLYMDIDKRVYTYTHMYYSVSTHTISSHVLFSIGIMFSKNV